MDMEEKNKYISQYIIDVAKKINTKYKGLIDKEKIILSIDMFKNSSDDLETIISKINKLAQKVIEDFLEFQKQIEEIMNKRQQEELSELATLDLNTEENGIYLSQQQIDLLMIADINSKEELKYYIENICGQFPNMTVYDVIPNFISISTAEELEEAKKILFQKYQNSLISYLENEEMTNVEKSKVKLERLGINGEELQRCLQKVSQGKISEVFKYLGQKYGDDFIKKFNHSMNYDFENIKDISYEEILSLSQLIKRDKSLDTIISATGKYNTSIYQTLNENIFDPYLTNKTLQFCYVNKKHMRYHALFDQAHVDSLLQQGKGLQDHDQILAEMKEYIKKTMDFIEKNNKQLPDGTMLINEIEIFNELIEKNKENKNSSYAMVWEKYFGITIDEIISCFSNITKPEGIEFMYNETTLTESPEKRKMVEKILFQIEEKKSDLIDRFGDQMHLSDEDVLTQNGRKNLVETAQMLKRIQDGRIIVDGKVQQIRAKKTECTEHDFHFTPLFLEKIGKLQQNDKNIKLWSIKRKMQNIIARTYIQNGVKFEKSTYWSLFGKNDHNLCRTNIAIQKKNKERSKKGLPCKPIMETMSAGLIPEGKNFNEFKSLNNKQNNSMTIDIKKAFDQRSQIEIQIAEKIKQKNQIIKQQKEQKENKPKVKLLTVAPANSRTKNNKGFTNILILSLIVSIAIGSLLIIFHMLLGR